MDVKRARRQWGVFDGAVDGGWYAADAMLI